MRLALRCDRLEAAIEASRDGLWDLDLLTGEIHYSTGWAAMLGHRPEELGNAVADALALTHPDDQPRLEAAIEHHVAAPRDEPYRLRFRLRHRDGHWVEVLSRGQVIRNHANEAVRFVGTHVDLSTMAAA